MKTEVLFYKKKLIKIFKLFLFINLLFIKTSSFAQKQKSNLIINNFQNYASEYRELAYSQLNKSTYIKGETLGFCSYIVDKAKKTPSLLTKNLYCVITDENNQIIKSKLIKVNRGIAYNSFEIDSLFSSGKYTFKAYTNWMKNFDEPNAFIESFKVIDPEKKTYLKRSILSNSIDVQFLPEGGHFVNNIKTKVGVTIKNNNGYGIPNVVGEVYDSHNTSITSFKTNSVGICSFSLLPKTKQNYIVKITHLDKEYKYIITGTKSKGVSIKLSQVNNKVFVELNTNQETLKNIKNKPFKLIIHNGDIIKEGLVKFNKTGFIKIIDQKNLLPGINIFTLFDENNNPILERLFFNYKGIETLRLEEAKLLKKEDSLQVDIPFSQLSNSLKNNMHLSVSILPKETKSYQKNHNIISYTHLQPYVKGYVENAGYYFTNINRKKKYHLDNLLLTQGWSSYNWNSIFENNTSSRFAFENGITIKVNKNNINNSEFFISPLKLNNPSIINIEENKKYFVEDGLYPLEEESLKLSVLNKKGKLIKPNLYVQFSPNKIPLINNYLKTSLPPKNGYYSYEFKTNPFSYSNLDEYQNLDEAIINVNLKQQRIDKIQSKNWGDIYLIDDSHRRFNLRLSNYITSYVMGFTVTEYMGQFILSKSSGKSSFSSAPPTVYLDDVIQSNLDFLHHFSMDDIDYLVANRHGFGEGMRGSNGVLKIYTRKTSNIKRKIDNNRKFDFPLTFSSNKKFYTPKYTTYNTSFYKEYGVIDWIPNVMLDNEGNLSFKIHNPANTNILLFIEGITQDGKYIVAKKILNIDSNK
ncbi:hypothetical protein [Tenacibaculum sp. Ill]|uniref:hypothetical protein n=1 Tax=Tenacibaculum sp. Ill TaxID=3445935 RepID=UPI003F790E91